MSKTFIDRLRGNPLVKLNHFATVYKQGTLICVLIVLALSIWMPSVIRLLGSFGMFLGGFAMLFGSALAVKMELSNGGEI